MGAIVVGIVAGSEAVGIDQDRVLVALVIVISRPVFPGFGVELRLSLFLASGLRGCGPKGCILESE